MKSSNLFNGPLALLGIILATSLQAQNAEWAKLIHGQYTDTPSSLCRDNNDNIYVCGRMSSGDIDGHEFGVAGTYDAFLAKFNPDGTYQWAIRAGGGYTAGPMNLNEGDGSQMVRYDSITNAIYMSGSYQATDLGDSARFGPGISVTGRGAFLAKYDLDGNCIWMRSTQNGGGRGFAIDEAGAVYFYVFSDESTGNNITTFDASPAVVVPNGPSVAKYTLNGQLLWAKSLGHNIDGRMLVRRGLLYFIGGNYYTGSTLLDQPIVENATNGVAVLAAMDTSCTSVQWMHLFLSNTNSLLQSAEFATNGEIFLSGSFQDSLFLANDTLVSTSTANDILCLLVDSLGNEIWNLTLNATGPFRKRISKGEDGSFYLAFGFEGSFTFNSQTITAAHDLDFAVVRISPAGILLSLETNGPVESGYNDVVTLSDGSPVVAYGLVGTIDFGNNISLFGGADIFVAKLGIITGIQTLALPNNGDLLIYANPNQGTCGIELPPDLLHEPGLVLRIMDAQGRVVQESPLNISEGTVHLDIRAQATGTYVAEVSNGTKRYTGRIVFEE